MTAPNRTAVGIPELWHYTCEHGNRSIEDTARRAGRGGRGLIRLGLDGYVWATDLDTPVREALGLTSHSITCDRLAHRWHIDTIEAVAFFRPWVEERRHLPRARIEALEGVDGILVRHWFVSTTPVWADRS